jgi:hypothetical protein
MLCENVDIEHAHTGMLTPYWAPGTSPGVTGEFERPYPRVYPRLSTRG